MGFLASVCRCACLSILIIVALSVLSGSASLKIRVNDAEFNFGDEREWDGWQPSLIGEDDQRHFDTLQVSRDATAKEIRASYKKLALKHHPDKVGQSCDQACQDTFVEIQNAYEKLKGYAPKVKSEDMRRRRR